jgi:hypothetical protein
MKTFRPSFSAAAMMALGMSASVWAVGPCPSVGASSFQGDNSAYITAGGGCNAIVTVTTTGSTVAIVNSNPYDGSDDTLVGVVNNTATTLSQITVSGSNISGFEGDGICTFGAGGLAGTTFTAGSSAYCTTQALNGTDPQDYQGPAQTFTNFASGSAVTIVFSPPLAPGGTSFFSLEEAPSNTLVVTAPGGPPVTTTPVPSSLFLAGIGILALSGFYFYSRRTSRA